MATNEFLQDYKAALRQGLSTELNDLTKRRTSTMNLLLGLDNLYKTPGTRFRKLDTLGGDDVSVDFLVSQPVIAGIPAKTGSIAAQAIVRARNYSTVTLKHTWSYYAGSEVVYKSHVLIHQNSPKSLTPHVDKVTAAMTDAWHKTISDDMWPLTFVGPTGGVPGTGLYTESKIMAFDYPLQGGYTGNALAGGATVYEYMGCDLNSAGPPDFTQVKALQAGLTGTPFGAWSPSNFRTKIKFPMRNDRGVEELDLGICDSATMDSMIQQAEGKLLLDMGERLNYGAEVATWCGVNWVIEGRLDKRFGVTGKREAVIGDSSKIIYHHVDWSKNLEVIEEVPDSPTIMLLQNWQPTSLTNENPRNWAHAFDLTP